MAAKQHRYDVALRWLGDTGAGTRNYASYERTFVVASGDKPPIHGSADPQFRGDGTKWNPEEMLVAALSACHQLWYLHLCAVHGVTVVAYEDRASGVMAENDDGSGQFVLVTLRPEVGVTPESDCDRAVDLHAEAAKLCFIARSMNFRVEHEPVVRRRA
jgi:organic hydroperoxide reductase OsmC/OhrA